MKSLLLLLLTALFLGVTSAFSASITLRSSIPQAAPFARQPISVQPLSTSMEATGLHTSPQNSEQTLSSFVTDNRSSTISKRFPTFKERLLVKLLKKQLTRYGMREGEPADPQKLRMGRLALVFGAGAFVILLVPVLGILSPLMAIAGIVLGIVSIQGNSNLPGILGICFGGAFLLLLVAAVVFVIIGLTSWF